MNVHSVPRFGTATLSISYPNNDRASIQEITSITEQLARSPIYHALNEDTVFFIQKPKNSFQPTKIEINRGGSIIGAFHVTEKSGAARQRQVHEALLNALNTAWSTFQAELFLQPRSTRNN